MSNLHPIFEQLLKEFRPHNLPEETLEVWQCRHCECDCAGIADASHHLCNDCLMKELDADDRNEFDQQQREERETSAYELQREYSNYNNP